MKIIQHKDWKGRAVCPRCKILYEDIEPELLICDMVYVHAPIRLVDIQKHPAIFCPKCLRPVWIQDYELIPEEYMEKFVNNRCFVTMDTYQATELDGLSYLTDEQRKNRIPQEEWHFITEQINNYRRQLGLPEKKFW